MNFEAFREAVERFVDNSVAIKPKLYHLHFTISDCAARQVFGGENYPNEYFIVSKIEENEPILTRYKYVESDDIPVHVIQLLPDLIQHHTVYKSTKLENVFEKAKQLFSLDKEGKISLHGAKLECLFSTKDLMSPVGVPHRALDEIARVCSNQTCEKPQIGLETLPPFNYIELHFEKFVEHHQDFDNDQEDSHDPQLVSNSLKKNHTVSSIRVEDNVENRQVVLGRIKKWFDMTCADQFNSRNGRSIDDYKKQQQLIEVSIYDAWNFDIEKEWKCVQSQQSIAERVSSLSS